MNDIDVHLVRARQAILNAVAVVPHTDADGLAAGAIALRARGEDAGRAVLLGGGDSPYRSGSPLPDGPLALLGWGVRELQRAAVFVDHHVPETGPRADQIILSSYGEQPAVPTAPLMRRVVPDAPAWLAAVGAVCELGPAGLRLRECAGTPEEPVRRLAGLVDAPRRCPGGPVADALALLVDHDHPDSALADPRICGLEEAKREWKAEYERVVEVEPLIADGAALLRFSSRCRVQPLVAATWARRLAPRVVVAANEGYAGAGDRVVFSVRGGQGSLPALLRSVLPDVDGDYAHGHDRASGGSLPPDDGVRLLGALGLRGV
ncbi:MAG: hypothetical protein ACXVVU_27230 [Solirubrobacteraceae bacterium]